MPRILFAAVNGDRVARDSDYEQGLFLTVSGRLAIARSRHGEASTLFGEAYRLFLQDGFIAEAARAAFFRACAEICRGDKKAIELGLRETFELSAKLDSKFILTSAARQMNGLLDSVIKVLDYSGDIERLRGAVTDLEQRIPEIRRSVRPQLVTVPFDPPKLSVKALGAVQVTLDDRPIDQSAWKNKAMVMELFYYVLAQYRGVTKEELGLVFWPEFTSTEIRIKLKNTLYRLRQTVKQEVIIFEDDRYLFNRSLDYEYDVEIFWDKLASAEISVDSADKIACLQEAINLYRGPYLPEVMGSWVLPERERLWRVYSSAVLELAQLQLEQGLESDALENCLDLLLVDPCLESAHRLAMQIHAALGDRAALIRQYEHCCRTLKEEVRRRAFS